MQLKGKILYADDDLDFTDPYYEHLELNYYKVTIARDSDKFFNLLKAEQWSVIILDIMFPRGECFSREDSLDNRRTGLLILRKIKTDYNDDKTSKIPVIIRTAVTDNQELKEKCLGLGILEDFYFEKPGNLKKFMLAIEKAVKLYNEIE